MTFKNANRVEETSTTTGTGTYTLDGASTGRQSFVSGVGANNHCTYVATDDTNWEIGIGQVLTGPNRLTREKILSSSNAGAAVNWGSGTRKIRQILAAEFAAPRVVTKSVAGGTDVTLTQDEQRCDILILTGALTASINVIVDATPWTWTVYNNTSGAFTLTVKVSGQTGVTVTQGKRGTLYCDGIDVRSGFTDFPPETVEVPAGTVIYFAAPSPPGGYLKANGAAVSRTTYAALFSAIGTTFGTGNGSTTFNLPDLRGEFVRGWDDGRGVDGGRAFGSSQIDTFQGHYHRQYRFDSLGSTGAGNYAIQNYASNTNNTAFASSDTVREAITGVNGAPRTSDETRPRNVALLACIKY